MEGVRRMYMTVYQFLEGLIDEEQSVLAYFCEEGAQIAVQYVTYHDPHHDVTLFGEDDFLNFSEMYTEIEPDGPVQTKKIKKD
jgi:hypothetical protein